MVGLDNAGPTYFWTHPTCLVGCFVKTLWYSFLCGVIFWWSHSKLIALKAETLDCRKGYSIICLSYFRVFCVSPWNLVHGPHGIVFIYILTSRLYVGSGHFNCSPQKYLMGKSVNLCYGPVGYVYSGTLTQENIRRQFVTGEMTWIRSMKLVHCNLKQGIILANLINKVERTGAVVNIHNFFSWWMLCYAA